MKTEKLTDNKFIAESNELIAQFMKGVHHQHAEIDLLGIRLDGTRVYSGIEFKYHTSWDWLMPVVEKIDGIYDYDRSMYDAVVHLPISTSIGEVYKAVVEFIKWYNQQKA